MKIGWAVAAAIAVAAAPVSASPIKSSEVAARVAAALAAIDVKNARPGVVTRLAWIKKPANQAAAYKTIRQGLVAAKLTVVSDSPTHDGLTVEHANGSRATVVFHGVAAVYLIARPTRRQPRGRCVKPPAKVHQVTVNASGIDQMGEVRTAQTRWKLETIEQLDVDGDGVLDWFVPIAAKHDCPESVRWDVYLRRRACGHRLGRVGPGALGLDAQVAPIDASGYRPLALESETTAFGKSGPPEMTTTTSRFAVRNGRYRRTKRAASTGVCHHCATWSCRSP